ncbi:isopentenyl-diphosphate Delta-isomerase [bacterium SCSIO 12643]|nr:isopentenyl-diphosphate Delta-isomerase [bacterium SCSIO 12643]
MEEQVVLVDQEDNQIGLMGKMEAHEKGLLHRAFSIFVFNSKGELLIQQRAHTKYHSAGEWANTCCSHQRDGESTLDAAHRRLQEEMGFDVELNEVFSFTYKKEFGNGLTEHEFDHVIFGQYDDAPVMNPEEVADWKYISIEDLKKDIELEPEKYTIWLQIALKEVETHLSKS